jgi:serine/threonine-protein kinase
MAPQPGDIIGGKYRIVRMIGDGGMGAVYEARHQILGTSVALKFLHADLAKRPGLSSRFLQEARVSASIQSPHVTKVTDVDQTPDGAPFLVMELLTGEALQQLLDRSHKLPKDQAIDFTLQVLSGLEAAHALGVVHRDLKPDNVFITPSPGGPVCKLLDFGIAKLRQSNEYTKGLTRPGALMGTPEYMSPEQLYSADRVDHRADLYSLGVMLFEMLSGERPAQGEDAAAIVGNVMAGKVRRLDELMPSLPKELVDVAHRAIDPDKGRRFQSAVEMRVALAPFAGQLSHAGKLAATPVPTGASGPPPPATEGAKPDPATEKQGPPVTADEPALERPKTAKLPQQAASGGVAPTLPPDDDGPTQETAAPSPEATRAGTEVKGSTQEASKELIADLAAQNAAAQAVPAQTAHSAGVGYTPPPMTGTYGQYGPPGTRKKSGGGLGTILVILAGLALTAGIVGLVLYMRQGKDDGPTPPLGGDLEQPTPNATISAQGGQDFNTPPVVPPTNPDTPVGPGPQPTATATNRPPTKKDAGADSGAAQDSGLPPLQWPLPMPSGLPPLPSTLPPIPTFPIPGFQPPPSGDQ